MSDAHQLDCALVTSLLAAQQVRALRNTGYDSMTNHRRRIGWMRQSIWFYRSYRPAQKRGTFRVFLFRRGSRPVGYGALHLDAERLLVTECVDARCRGEGIGRAILRQMIEIARAERRELVAEIWADNTASIHLHEGVGLKLRATSGEPGQELRRYSLPSPAE